MRPVPAFVFRRRHLFSAGPTQRESEAPDSLQSEPWGSCALVSARRGARMSFHIFCVVHTVIQAHSLSNSKLDPPGYRKSRPAKLRLGPQAIEYIPMLI
jgi:hypothetical protein